MRRDGRRHESSTRGRAGSVSVATAGYGEVYGGGAAAGGLGAVRGIAGPVLVCGTGTIGG
jgi:hypothetical protein